MKKNFPIFYVLEVLVLLTFSVVTIALAPHHNFSVHLLALLALFIYLKF